ncbi:MAG TPA: type II CAAX endopeptidase family protein [Candidatus Angelobacter sp.]
MEPQTEAVAPPSTKTIRLVFFNERGLRAGWRLAIYSGTLQILLFLFSTVFSFLSRALRGPQGRALADSPLWMTVGNLAYFIPAVFAAWIMSRIERRKAGVYGLPLTKSALSRFAVGYAAWGFLPLTLVLLTMRGLGVFYFGSLSVRGSEALYWGAAWGIMFLSVGLLEEYLFRGYALYTLADGIGFWPAAIILAVAFAAVHMSNGGENRVGIAGVFLFALFAAATLRRTGNLWLAVGAHAGWDWGQSFFYGVSDSGFQPSGQLLNPHFQGPGWLSGGSVGPEGSIVTLIFWALMTAGFLLFYRASPDSPEKNRQTA